MTPSRPARAPRVGYGAEVNGCPICEKHEGRGLLVGEIQPAELGGGISAKRTMLDRPEPGVPTEANPRTGPYKQLFEAGRDLHELHALMAPRPFLVSGGSEDPPERWKALNHSIAVNRLLGRENRVAMTNRPAHSPTEQSNEQIYLFFEYFLKYPKAGRL